MKVFFGILAFAMVVSGVSFGHQLCEAGKVPIATLSASAPAKGKTAEERKNSLVEAALKHFEKTPAGTKLFVLPEAFITPLPNDEAKDFKKEEEARPYAYTLPKLRAELTDAPLSKFAAVAFEKQAFIHVGLLELEGDRVYNTVIVIGPDRKLVAKHRKVNLYEGTEGNETDYVTRGEHTDTSYDASAVGLGRVGLAVCADIYERKGRPHLMEKFRSSDPPVHLLAVSADWQEKADSEDGPTKGWGPHDFFSETARYLNYPAAVAATNRYDPARLREAAPLRKDREVYVAVSNTTEKAPTAGTYGPGGRLIARNGNAEGWVSACVPQVARPPAHAAPKGSHR